MCEDRSRYRADLIPLLEQHGLASLYDHKPAFVQPGHLQSARDLQHLLRRSCLVRADDDWRGAVSARNRRDCRHQIRNNHAIVLHRSVRPDMQDRRLGWIIGRAGGDRGRDIRRLRRRDIASQQEEHQQQEDDVDQRDDAVFADFSAFSAPRGTGPSDAHPYCAKPISATPAARAISTTSITRWIVAPSTGLIASWTSASS